MANPTTNYGFVMPTPTDLVTDLPADFEVFGQDVDSQMKTNADAATQKATLTTTGDIYYASAAGTPARLGIGSTNQVLKVTGGLPVWGSGSAGNLTEVVFTASNATYTIPTGVTGIWALCVGGGGGGGASSTATLNNSGGGGGAGQVLEKFFAITGGDTTLNITVGGGGAGGTAGGKGSSGSTSSIVGNTSATTYASAAGGGGAGGGAAANTSGVVGASGGGNGSSSAATLACGGGGMGTAAMNSGNAQGGLFNGLPNTIGGGQTATTAGITGYDAGSTGSYGGTGILMWGRALAGGGSGVNTSTVSLNQSFGAGANTSVPSAGTAATANTGAGGGGAKTNANTALSGGNGGSGLVVLRFIS
jgi:hypothetical protein